MIRIPAGLLASLFLSSLPGPAQAQVLDTTLWVPSSFVSAIIRSGNTIYLGGRFTEIGPPTGSGVVVDPTAGMVPTGYPKVRGDVLAAAPDGAGGWYIGGNFTAINGAARSCAAHIKADHTISEWNPNVQSGGALRVNTIVVWGSQIFLGGFFSSAGGQARNNIAAVDRSTGLATAWDANANVEVVSIAVGLNTLYAGGRFTQIGGQLRNRIAEIDTLTGAATAWNPNANLQVNGVLRNGPDVYAWGDFTQIGGQTRSSLGALNAVTGLASAWYPRQLGTVRAVVARNGVVYMGGDFTSFFSGAQRNYLAAVDSATGAVTPWNPNAGGGPFNGTRIRTLAFHGPRLLAGGSFKTIGAQSRTCIAALDTMTAQATAWDPHAGGELNALASDGTSIFAGGTFRSMNAVTRNRIAALDATTGIPTSWNPNASGDVLQLRTRDATVYASGSFNSIGGVGGPQLAALDSVTGLALPGFGGSSFAPSNYLYALEPSGSMIFLGGDLTMMLPGGVSRTDLGAVERNTGAGIGDWDPRPSDAPGNLNAVNALSLRGSRLFVGGRFGYIGGLYRHSLAALDTLTSQADFTWDPDPNDDVSALLATPTRIYAGGQFTSIGGQPQSWLAALDPLTAEALDWTPSLNGTATLIGEGAGFVCIGGAFTTVGGQSRIGLAAVDAVTGEVLAWNPDHEGSFNISCLHANEDDVYIGGTFGSLDGQPMAFFGGYHFPTMTAKVDPARLVTTNRLRAWPNPFVDRVSFAFSLPAEQNVRVEVIDIAGRRVWSSPEARMRAGAQSIIWNGGTSAAPGAAAASGIYFVRIVGQDFVASRRIVRL